MTSPEHAWLERVAITVTDVEKWIGLFEELLGPGFKRATVQQSNGPVAIAVHPAGIELVEGTVPARPELRSFHLASKDIELAATIARGLGWEKVDTVSLEGRRHDVLDAEGLRLLLVDGSDDGDVGPAETERS